MHPNCRHEFIPFVEKMQSPEKLKEIIKDSNDIKEYSKDDKMFDLYKRGQAQHRQLVKESKLFHQIKNELGDDAPYSNIASFRRAYRSSEKSKLKYARTHYYNRDKAQFERWKETISEELPETLDEFQKIKYTKYDKYVELNNFREYKKDNPTASLNDYFLSQEAKTLSNGKPSAPPKIVSVDSYAFRNEHINQERSHDVERKQAEFYINESFISFSQWNGRRVTYYSKYGATCIDLKTKEIITAFSEKEFSENIKNFIRGNYGKYDRL